MSVEVRRARPGDDGLFERIADDVFDHAVELDVLAEYLAAPGHHFVIAIADGVVVGSALVAVAEEAGENAAGAIGRFAGQLVSACRRSPGSGSRGRIAR